MKLTRIMCLTEYALKFTWYPGTATYSSNIQSIQNTVAK
jgi:hypothetical protein